MVIEQEQRVIADRLEVPPRDLVFLTPRVLTRSCGSDSIPLQDDRLFVERNQSSAKEFDTDAAVHLTLQHLQPMTWALPQRCASQLAIYGMSPRLIIR